MVARLLIIRFLKTTAGHAKGSFNNVNKIIRFLIAGISKYKYTTAINQIIILIAVASYFTFLWLKSPVVKISLLVNRNST